MARNLPARGAWRQSKRALRIGAHALTLDARNADLRTCVRTSRIPRSRVTSGKWTRATRDDMDKIDLPKLLAPISAEFPSGPDLKFDPLFLSIEDALRTEPEQQFGETIVPAGEPDWSQVRTRAVDLLSRSKDLRAAVYLVQALVHDDGLRGLAQGLALIRGLLEGFWDTLHPQLDPDDDLDPTARVNTLASLCDPESVLHAVRSSPMLKLPGLGGVALRDLQIARGEIPAPPDAETVLKLDSIDAAVRDVDPPALDDAANCVAEAFRDTASIEQYLMEKVGVTHAISLAALSETLAEIDSFFQSHLSARQSQLGAHGLDGSDHSAVEAANSGGVDVPSRQKQRLAGEVTCPEDVTKALDKIIAYYAASEPSSPVPLLLKRAQRLVSQDFMEILRDIAPDALAQAETVTGYRLPTSDD
jgi:type VI secretion system protein ImpA